MLWDWHIPRKDQIFVTERYCIQVSAICAIVNFLLPIIQLINFRFWSSGFCAIWCRQWLVEGMAFLTTGLWGIEIDVYFDTISNQSILAMFGSGSYQSSSKDT